jgi:hypothetical protein
MEEQKFKTMKIGEIEKGIKDSLSVRIEAEKELFAALAYLHTTKRFRENPMFKKSDFFTYIRNMYGMTRQAYYVLRLAYVRFSSESDQYGPGVIADIAKNVGVKNVASVVKKIQGEAEKAAMTAEKIKSILQEEAEKVSRKAGKPPKPIESMAALKSTLNKVGEESRKKDAAMADKDARISKLIATVNRIEGERDELILKHGQEVEALQEVIKEKDATIRNLKAQVEAMREKVTVFDGMKKFWGKAKGSEARAQA